MKKLMLILFLSISAFANDCKSQTLGVLQHNDGAFDGYTLFNTFNDSTTYLIDNCGRIINKWDLDSEVASMVYLRKDGSLLRGAVDPNAGINGVGSGGLIQIADWDGNILWEAIFSDSTVALHHDIHPMDNGNILAIAYEKISKDDLIQMGRDSAAFAQDYIYSEVLYEIEPIGTSGFNIVWEWHATDHLIQDFDATKDNFGVVKENLNRINVNYRQDNEPNWIHLNGIFYDEDRDHILLSSRKFSEIWVLDHSTTTAQAATSIGGNSNLGGSLIYRRGNDFAHGIGAFNDNIQFGQHDVRIIQDGLFNGGSYMLFNNGAQRPNGSYSSVDVFSPVFNETTMQFETQGDSIFTPVSLLEEYTASPKEDFFSGFISGAERLPNNNILVCEGAKGRFFEVDQNDSIVWEYINPVSFNLGILNQGDTATANIVFRAKRYAKDYEGFNNLTITPGEPIEQNPLPLPEKCLVSSVSNANLNEGHFALSPNPASNYVTLVSVEPITSVVVYNLFGQKVTDLKDQNSTTVWIPLNGLSDGIYIVEINNKSKEKLVLKN